MALYIGPDVLLANLIVTGEFDEGVTLDNIEKYIKLIKEGLAKKDFPPRAMVYFGVNSRTLKEICYGNDFREFQGKFFKKIESKIKLRHFNARYDLEIAEMLQEIAKKVATRS